MPTEEEMMALKREHERESKVESLIEKKREEIIAEVSNAAEGMENKIIENANVKFSLFAETLKNVYNTKVVGPEDLLRVLEKDGFIYHKVVDPCIDLQYTHDENDTIDIGVFLREITMYENDKWIRGKQRVTIIIEPLENEKD